MSLWRCVTRSMTRDLRKRRMVGLLCQVSRPVHSHTSSRVREPSFDLILAVGWASHAAAFERNPAHAQSATTL